VLGIALSPDLVVGALNRLQLSSVLHNHQIEVAIPSWRLDLNHEIDLVEEVARVVGYDKIPVRDEIAIRLQPPEPQSATLDAIRSTLTAAGYFEAVTFTFVTDALAEDFLPPEARSLPRADPSVRAADAQLRPSILPGLLESVRRNESTGTPGARLFEIGPAFWYDAAGALQERRRLALVGPGELRQITGLVETILSRLNQDLPLRIIPDSRPGFAQGSCGRIQWGDRTVGHLGLIARSVSDKLSLRLTPAAAELELDILLQHAQRVPQLKPLPRFPAVRRDLSLIVSEAVRYEQVESLIRHNRSDLLEEVEYVTTYRGKPLAAATKSVTVTLVFRSPTSTLTAEQVEPHVRKIIDAAKASLGAELRT